MTHMLRLKITLPILFLCVSAAVPAQNPMAFGGDLPGKADAAFDWNRGIFHAPLGLPEEVWGAGAPGFLRIGGGLPGQTHATLNYGFHVADSAVIGLSGVHAGRFDDVVNDLGISHKRNSSQNRFGLFWRSGREVKLDVRIDYRHDLWTRYGHFVYGGSAPVEEPVTKQNYSAPMLAMRLGHDFTDLSKLNFAVAADAYYIEDGYHNRESGGSFGVDLAQMIDARNGLSIGAAFEGTVGEQKLRDYENVTFRLSPAYLAKPLRKLDITLGVNIILDMRKTFTSVSMFLPRVRASWTGGVGWKVFAELDGRLERNNFMRLTERNPYVRVDSLLPLNTRRTELRAGIEGKSRDERFAYKLYGGSNVSKHAVVFANSYAAGKSSTFRPLREAQLTEYFGGLKLRAQVTDGFSAEAAGHVYSHQTRSYAHANGLPKYDFEALINYAVLRDLSVYAGVTMLGTRYFLEFQELEEYDAGNGNIWMIGGWSRFHEVKPTTDLRAGVQYWVNYRTTIFVEGHNLLGEKLYNYFHYPECGTVINFGVSIDL